MASNVILFVNVDITTTIIIINLCALALISDWSYKCRWHQGEVAGELKYVPVYYLLLTFICVTDEVTYLAEW